MDPKLRSLVIFSSLFILFSSATTLAQMNSNPFGNQTGNQGRANQPRLRGIDWSRVGSRSQEEGRYVTDVWLDLRTMPATDAQSEDEFYLSFPTLDRRHQYRYLTRRRDGGLRLRFTPTADARQNQRIEGPYRFHWQLQGRPGDDDCALTDCNLPSIPIEDMEPVEIHSSVSGMYACDASDALGVDRATITYGLNNGETRRFEITNQWVPCPQFDWASSDDAEISQITLTIRRDRPTSSLGREVKAWLNLSSFAKIPLTTQNHSGVSYETLTYQFMESRSAYETWVNNLSDSTYWLFVQRACLAQAMWSRESQEECEVTVENLRGRSRSSSRRYIDIACAYEYHPSCRYPPLETLFIDTNELEIGVQFDRAGWFGGDWELAPVTIDGIDLAFIKRNGEQFTVSQEADFSVPCASTVTCEMEVNPETIWSGQDVTLSWRLIGGTPSSLSHNLVVVCPGYSGRWPDREGAELPREGEVLCRPGGDFGFQITTVWHCPTIEPAPRRIGLEYRDSTYNFQCRKDVSYEGNRRLEDTDGCRYNFHGWDERHGYALTLGQMNNYIRRFQIDYEEWDELMPDYYYYQNRDAFKRIANAIHFMKSARWEHPDTEIMDGRAVRDFFYDFSADEIDDIDRDNECDWGWSGQANPVTSRVRLGRSLIFESHPLERAATIFHEAWHIATWAMHVDCSDGWPSFWGRCDESFSDNGAYAASVAWYSWIYNECVNCSPITRELARQNGNAILDGSFYNDPDFRL